MLRIQADDIAIMANNLDRIHRSAFPVAVRNTLNNMAYKMQQKEIAKSAENFFDYKRTNIVRNLSRFSKAQGFDVKRMQSRAGIVPKPRREKVASGLAAQEFGGKVEGKSVPTLRARGGSVSSKVRQLNRLGSNKGIVDARHHKRERFVARAWIAYRHKKLLMTKSNYSQVFVLARVGHFNRRRGQNPEIGLNWLYSVHDKGKEIRRQRKKPFVKEAYIKTMNGFSKEFVKQAEKKLKLKKK